MRDSALEFQKMWTPRELWAMLTPSRIPMPPQSPLHWTASSRAAVFALSASSIGCLLVEFYGLCSMRVFTLWVFLPALAALGTWAVLDRLRGGGAVWRVVWMGLAAGLLAALAYDVFRLPFVFARQWGLDAFVPALNLFKVFPRFGAMILGQELEQPSFSPAAHLVGWLYHFSNGATFGVMYLALVGPARWRAWGWAVVFALGLELGMLFTPYPKVFGIPLTATFVAVTVAAHAVFGATLGWVARWFSSRLAIQPDAALASVSKHGGQRAA